MLNIRPPITVHSPTDQNCNNFDIKSRLISGNTFYHLVRNPLSFSLPSKNKNFKIDITINVLLVLCGCEASSLTLREER